MAYFAQRMQMEEASCIARLKPPAQRAHRRLSDEIRYMTAEPYSSGSTGAHRSALAGSPAQTLRINSLTGSLSISRGFQYGLLTAMSAALSTSSSFRPKSFRPLFTFSFSSRMFSPWIASPLLPGSASASFAIASGTRGALYARA
ncbi:hypothetical protein N8I77_012209 [Diaporthe amygdali]|uniref:Uncharacterized protein n=1 Tax=Phomopsis amygdali TaxID=1214568 RepID=A0AAD9S4B2_PHOAM|nr:hypothetical protein N8I77_012209 [Diaporthe amygdali]